MSSTQKLVLSAAIVGGVCGIAGAALYVAWRLHTRSAADRATDVLRQLEKVADRMEQGLHRSPPVTGLRLDRSGSHVGA